MLVCVLLMASFLVLYTYRIEIALLLPVSIEDVHLEVAPAHNVGKVSWRPGPGVASKGRRARIVWVDAEGVEESTKESADPDTSHPPSSPPILSR